MGNSNSKIKGKMIYLVPGRTYDNAGAPVEFIKRHENMSGTVKYKFKDENGEFFLLTRHKVIQQISPAAKVEA